MFVVARKPACCSNSPRCALCRTALSASFCQGVGRARLVSVCPLPGTCMGMGLEQTNRRNDKRLSQGRPTLPADAISTSRLRPKANAGLK